MKELKEMMRQWRRSKRIKDWAMKRQRNQKEAYELIQPKEFGGVIYIAFGGQPLVAVSEGLAEKLEEVRATYILYQEKMG